jgi:hypothetical protein
LAPAAEARGFDSVWSPEHSHIPLSRESAFPSGGELPKKYYDAMDPFVALMAAARDQDDQGRHRSLPDHAARSDPDRQERRSIDQLSKGRFLFGVGNGWNKDEMRNHGTVFETRHKLARERVEAMKVIWTKSKPEYHGELVNFDPDDDLAQAGAEAAPADPGRRRLPLRRAPRHPLRRRLDAAPLAAALRQRARVPARSSARWPPPPIATCRSRSGAQGRRGHAETGPRRGR